MRNELPAFFAAAEGLGYTVPEAYLAGLVDRVAAMPLVKLRGTLREQGIDVNLFLAETPFQFSIISRRRQQPTEYRSVWLVSPEDLVLLKLLAGRPRDLADVADVLFTQGDLDVAYMRQWAGRLGVAESLELALAEPR